MTLEPKAKRPDSRSRRAAYQSYPLTSKDTAMLPKPTPPTTTSPVAPTPQRTVTLDVSALHEAWRLGLVSTAEYQAVHTQSAVDALLFLVSRQRLATASDDVRAAWSQHAQDAADAIASERIIRERRTQA